MQHKQVEKVLTAPAPAKGKEADLWWGNMAQCIVHILYTPPD